MPMLQPQMMNITVKVYCAHAYIECLNEMKLDNTLKTVEMRIARVHTVKITMRYVRIDRVLCLSGRYMAKNLSPDKKKRREQ